MRDSLPELESILLALVDLCFHLGQLGMQVPKGQRHHGKAQSLVEDAVHQALNKWLHSYLQFQRLRLAALRVGRPFSSFIGPGIPLIRAQNDLRRAASAFVLGLGAGALRLLPVAALYFARPLAVSPAPFDTGSFSPRPTARDTPFLAIVFRRCKTAVRLLNPTNVALDTVNIHQRGSGGGSVRRNSVPNNNVLHHL